MLATWGAAIWEALTTLTISGFLIISVTVALLIVIVVEVLTWNKPALWAVICRALVTTLVVPIVFYGIQRTVEAPQRAAEVQDKQRSDALLNDVAARLGNQDAAKELIELRARALFAPATGDAESFAQNLLMQLSEKKVHHKALQDESAKESMRRRLDWESFLRAFLEQFDQRVAALQSRSMVSDVSTNEVALVQPGPQQHLVVRYLRTAGGYELRVRVHTGQVDFGKLSYRPSFYLAGTMRGDANREFMIVDFGPDHVTWDLGVAPPDRKSGHQVIGRDSQAEEYRQAVQDGLNLAFEYAVLATTK